jgi:hypothetical protein
VIGTATAGHAAAAAGMAAGAGRAEQHVRSSGDVQGVGAAAGTAAVKSAAAAGRSPGTRSSSTWTPSDVPAVGSVAMTTLPNTAAW